MKIIVTKDGTSTLLNEEFHATYHSTHGALQESQVVFIQNGLLNLLEHFSGAHLHILEIGFGTGLNFILTIQELGKRGFNGTLNYHGIEKYPVPFSVATNLGYDSLPFMSKAIYEPFKALHNDKILTGHVGDFSLEAKIIEEDFLLHQYPESTYDMVYYDAFGPGTQPDLWSNSMAEAMAHTLRQGGLLTTYCVQGAWRRHLKAYGFEVKKTPGPPGKREVMSAFLHK